ncbi:MAG: outer membrane protein transport protein [Rhodobacteraceae bacterium]|nr:outer membrane protein transport protein [Paracoccaceae bacterium]
MRELSAPGVGTAMSGATSAATDYSTAFTNPAGMTRFGRSGVQADLSYVLPSISFSGTGVSPLGTFYGGGDGGDAGEDKLVPAFYGVWAINPRLALGLSLNAPFGLATQYDDGWTGRYFALESEIQNPVLTPSLAWKATDKLSLGAGIQIGYADATLSRAVNLSALGLPDATSELKGDDYGVGYTLGMLYEFTPTSRIGLSYRSSVDYTLDGSATFSGVPDGVAALVPALSDSDATAKVTTPDVVSLGAYHEFSEKWTIMSEVSWTNWSTFKELRVKFDDGRADDVTEENWDDSWFFSLGAEYHPFEQHTFRFGVAYDESPVPDDSRTARIPDSDRYWLSLGYAYDFAPGRRVNIGYTHIFFDDIELAEATSSGSLTGDYTGSADVVSAGIQFSF